MSSDYRWLNEPDRWQAENGVLSVITDEGTDFWRTTWYGFERFSGHFYGCDVEGDFTFQVKISAEFSKLYDQAGIMLVQDERHWLKAGIEYNDGAPAIGSVLTLGYSDWATGPFPGRADTFWMRLTRKGESLRLQYSADGKSWPLLRLAHFPDAGPCRVGVMCCTPERAGLAVRFEDFMLGEPLDKALHDLT